MKNPFKKEPQPLKGQDPFPVPKRVVRSEELFKNEREIMILHGESYYRLQITKAGKLILNK